MPLLAQLFNQIFPLPSSQPLSSPRHPARIPPLEPARKDPHEYWKDGIDHSDISSRGGAHDQICPDRGGQIENPPCNRQDAVRPDKHGIPQSLLSSVTIHGIFGGKRNPAAGGQTPHHAIRQIRQWHDNARRQADQQQDGKYPTAAEEMTLYNGGARYFSGGNRLPYRKWRVNYRSRSAVKLRDDTTLLLSQDDAVTFPDIGVIDIKNDIGSAIGRRMIERRHLFCKCQGKRRP